MRSVFAVGVAVWTLVLAGSAPGAVPLPAQHAALHALAVARAAGHVDAATAAKGRTEIGRAAFLIRNLPGTRSRPIARCLSQVAALSGKLTSARARAVLGQLAVNDDWFARRSAPADKTDITDADGVVYRYFTGRCFEFHPLANFGALNADVAAGDTEAATRLAAALEARAVPEPNQGLGWEYYFDFGGRAPWLSGMAQAVAAQAFAAAGMNQVAGSAYRTIGRRLLTQVAAGPWIRLYAFSSLPVLNAQLQTVVSLKAYAAATGDPAATALAQRLQQSAAEMLSRFDTGYWSNYSLDGDPSPLDYQQYVVQLLKKLAPADVRFASAATRFAAYLKQPPAFKLANASVGATRFWLSKPASVQATSTAGPTRSLALNGGWHTVNWKLPDQPGIYPVRLTARDFAGNTAGVDALPLVRASAASGTASATRSTSAATAAQPVFMVGAAVDIPPQAALARQLGLGVVRVGVAWPAGAAAPDPGLVQALQKVPPSTSVVVELIASPLPADDPGRAALAAYAVSLAQQVPAVKDIVLTPAVTPATASGYAGALAVLRTALQAGAPAVATGAALDGAQAPRATLTALAAAASATGVEPVFDVLAFRPASATGTGVWTTNELPALEAALRNAFATPPPVLIDGAAVASQVPDAQLPLYGTPPAPGGLAEPAQAAAYAALLASTSCDPAVAGVILDRLVDTQTPAPPVGLFYPDGTPKTSATTVATAAALAQHGRTVCPGLQTPAAASVLTFPATLTSGAAAGVQLACVRDCLYLVTLEGPNGAPVVARRGALTGGAAAKVVGLPKAMLPPGDYTVVVRLVTQVNPGSVTELPSQPLTVT